MKRHRSFGIAALNAALYFGCSGLLLLAQQPPPLPPAEQPLGPDQLNNLVAPIALYPDPLISQILVASTYPLELVQASQWLQRHPELNGAALTQAVAQQNWDPSVQALVVFPDVIKRLNQDITWTTNLGNAFLGQEGEVMDAIQRMRLSAQQAEKLSTTPQQTVSTTTDAGRPVVVIQPANPAVVYVPYYDPVAIWGPPLYYPYPVWPYPPVIGGPYIGFSIGIYMGPYFGIGWGGWGGWGWFPGWGTRTVIVNNNFIHRYNFNPSRGGALVGSIPWTHDAGHRQGVPYPTPALSSRYGDGVRQRLQSRFPIPPSPGAERMGDHRIAPIAPANRGGFGGVQNGSAARRQSDHGYGSLGPSRAGGGATSPGGGSPPVQRGGAGAPRGGSSPTPRESSGGNHGRR